MKTAPIRFYQIDYQAQENGFVSQPHAHPHYEIFFLERGNARHFIDFEEHPIVDHSLFLVSKHQVHYITAEPHTYNYGFVVSIEPELVELLALELFALFGSFTQSPAYQLEANPFFPALFQQIKQELAAPKPKTIGIVFNLLQVLLTYVWRAATPLPSHPNQKETTFVQFIAHLEAHFTTIKSVQEYAKLMHLTTGQLNRLCKAHTNQTALKLIHGRINLEAKRKIFFSPMQIKDIGFQLGFEDAGHFNHFFKRLNGQSPKQFRAEMRQIFN